MGKLMRCARTTVRRWSFAGICHLFGIRFLLEIVAVFVALQIGLIIYSNQNIRLHCLLGSAVEPICRGRLQRGRYDNYHRYVIQDSVFVGADFPSPLTFNSSSGEDVCLATQTSIDKLHHVIEVGQHWQGLMSVAIFTPGLDQQTALSYFEYLSKCHVELMRNISFHFVFPINSIPPSRQNARKTHAQLWSLDERVESLECAPHPEEGLSSIAIASGSTAMSAVKPEKEAEADDQAPRQLLYPQNLMRNVARKNCASEYVLLTDVDVVPVMGLGPKLRAFLQLHGAVDVTSMDALSAYVLPTYEMTSNTNLSLPVNKFELLKFVRKKKARSFRSKAFKPNQGATNVSAWEALPNAGGPVPAVAYEVSKFNFYYEPFYLARDGIPLPPHDERFVGYGFTRNTQVYEMLLAGYKFFVLDNVFLVHRGMDETPFRTSARKKQVNHAWKKFFRFMDEIKVRHKTYNV